MFKVTLTNWIAWRRLVLRSVIFGISMFTLVFVPPSSGAEKEFNFTELDAESKVPLSLQECISIALKNNLDIRVEEFNPKIQEKAIIKEKAAFDPVASVRVSNQKSITSGTSLLSGAGDFGFSDRFPRWEDTLRVENLDFNAGISKKLLTGGECSLELTNDRFESNSIFQFFDSTYQSNLILSFHQPLLQGFGIDINRSKIKVASNNRNISKCHFKRKIIDIVSEVQERYWDLSFHVENLKAQKESLKLAWDLLERNKALVEVGKLAPIEILQAQVGVASREEGVLVAENAVKDAEDRLRRILNLMDTVDNDKQTIILTDIPLFVFEEIYLQETIESAIKNRLEYKQAQINLENKKLALKVAKNQMLPVLNLEGSYGLNGIDDSYGGGVDELSTGDRYSWHVGMSFQFPLGNRRSRSDYLEKELECKKSIALLEQLKKKL